MKQFVLVTDFDLNDPYIGQVKSVLLDQAPQIPILDLFSKLPAFNVKNASYLVSAYFRSFPEEAIFLCIVDPGVGSNRQMIICQIENRWFIGPNNGLLAILMRHAGISSYQIVEWQPNSLSNTFHGRDWIAPLAIKIAKSESFEVHHVDNVADQYRQWPDDLFEIIYFDHYGNAISGVRSSALNKDTVLLFNKYKLRNVRIYSDVNSGDSFWYENSNGLVEISSNQSSARDVLDIKLNDCIKVV